MFKSKKQEKKLALERETLRTLDPSLAAAVGGRATYPAPWKCGP
jgi:hypothetical protein